MNSKSSDTFSHLLLLVAAFTSVYFFLEKEYSVTFVWFSRDHKL